MVSKRLATDSKRVINFVKASCDISSKSNSVVSMNLLSISNLLVTGGCAGGDGSLVSLKFISSEDEELLSK